MSTYSFRVEMNVGQDTRMIDADLYSEENGWLVFRRKPPQGGVKEYWRVRLNHVVSIETVRYKP